MQNPPVYDTTANITPLLKLADYLSPMARAKRKAAIARANYEYRMFTSGDALNKKNTQWYMQTQRFKMSMEAHNKNMQLRELQIKKAQVADDGSLPGMNVPERVKRRMKKGGAPAPSIEPELPAPDLPEVIEEEENEEEIE